MLKNAWNVNKNFKGVNIPPLFNLVLVYWSQQQRLPRIYIQKFSALSLLPILNLSLLPNGVASIMVLFYIKLQILNTLVGFFEMLSDRLFNEKSKLGN